MGKEYIHGFGKKEQERLRRQAGFAEYKVFQDVNFSDCPTILEVGCGVGAQTEILLRRFPKSRITAIDREKTQLEEAKGYLAKLPYAKGRYHLHCMDAGDMDFQADIFSATFLCWTLEHVPDPLRVLSEIRRVLRPGGRLVVTEVMSSSFFLEPYSPNLLKYLMAFNDYQYDSGGDPFIGAKLGNLLLASGYRDVVTKVKTWHLDNRYPGKRKEGLSQWADLFLSARKRLLDSGHVDQKVVDAMIDEIKQVQADPNAVLFDAFFQATAVVY